MDLHARDVQCHQCRLDLYRQWPSILPQLGPRPLRLAAEPGLASASTARPPALGSLVLEAPATGAELLPSPEPRCASPGSSSSCSSCL